MFTAVPRQQWLRERPSMFCYTYSTVLSSSVTRHCNSCQLQSCTTPHTELLHLTSPWSTSIWTNRRYFLFLFQQPPSLLIREVSRSHSDTPQSVGLLWTSDQPVAQTSTRQHTTLTTDIRALSGIRTHNLGRLAAADPRLRPRSHRHRQRFSAGQKFIQILHNPNIHYRITKTNTQLVLS